ncbi:MAG TPA: homoserine O-succinyltransferase, partial [Aliidiomarina sp.]|nr:homoserine O-succinyltransferase [Aliidiomarina sp.]
MATFSVSRKPILGILNLMPNKEKTEQQWLRLIGTQTAHFNVQFITTQSYTSKLTDANYLKEKYHRGLPKQLDALIVTGAAFGKINYSEVLYWQELTEIMDTTAAQGIPVFYSCWAANAALFHKFGIPRVQYENKVSGVFPHRVEPHALTRKLPRISELPHSRYSESSLALVLQHPELNVLLQSAQAGAAFLTDQRKNAYLLAHPEYEIDTLYQEYLRDCSRGLKAERPLNDPFSANPGMAKKEPHWQQHGSLLLTNWLNLVLTGSLYRLLNISN